MTTKTKTLTIEEFRKSPTKDAIVYTSPLSIDVRSATVSKEKGDAEKVVGDLMERMSAPDAEKLAAVRAFTEFPDAGSDVSGFKLSSARVDSYKDTIDPKGWDLEDFKANPVVLFGHNAGAPPIGRDLARWADDTFLRGVVRYTSKEINPFGDMVARMVKHGFLNTTSVGFAPVEWRMSDDPEREGMFGPGLDFTKQKLKEWSVVPIPANPDALNEARSMLGLDATHMRSLIEWCEKTLDGEGVLIVPRTTVEHARRVAKGNSIAVATGLALVRVDAADEKPDAVEPDEEVIEDKAATATCPACGHSGPSADFMGGEEVPDEVEAEGDEEEEKADAADPDGEVIEDEDKEDDEEDEDELTDDEKAMVDSVVARVLAAHAEREGGGVDSETGEPQDDELMNKIGSLVQRRIADLYTERTGKLLD